MEAITKTCSRCKTNKPLSDFSNATATKDGKMYVCKQCNREINHEWRRTPSGIYTQLKSRQTHYGKTYDNRCKPIEITREEFISWYENESKYCYYCELPEDMIKFIHSGHLDRVFRLTVDCINNIIGYAKGNLVLACNRCNLIKSNVFTHDEMREIGMKYLKPKWEAELNQTITEEQI